MDNNFDTETVKAIAREAARKYKAAWRAKNREKIHEYNVRYWAKRVAKINEQEKTNND